MKAIKSIQKKVILGGGFASGKTALVQRFVHHRFEEAYQTTSSVTIAKKLLMVQQESDATAVSVSLSIWDLGELALERQGSAAYFAGAHAVVWLLDLSRPVSWLGLGQQMADWTGRLPAVPVLLAGSKADLVEREAVLEQLHRAQLNPEAWISARTGQGVEALFQDVARLALQ